MCGSPTILELARLLVISAFVGTNPIGRADNFRLARDPRTIATVIHSGRTGGFGASRKGSTATWRNT